MAPIVQMLQTMLRADSAYVKDGHVLCYANVAAPNPHDYQLPPYMRQNESDVLLWSPHTVLGLKADKCIEAPWSVGHPTINANRLSQTS